MCTEQILKVTQKRVFTERRIRTTDLNDTKLVKTRRSRLLSFQPSCSLSFMGSLDTNKLSEFFEYDINSRFNNSSLCNTTRQLHLIYDYTIYISMIFLEFFIGNEQKKCSCLRGEYRPINHSPVACLPCCCGNQGPPRPHF